jgi:predicted nucleic acid-binding protein
MEVLAGARDDQHLQQLRRLLARASTLPTESVDDDAAAGLYRSCRQQGHTVRKLIDCLSAAVAVCGDVPVLHLDADFDVLARHSSLRISTVALLLLTTAASPNETVR